MYDEDVLGFKLKKYSLENIVGTPIALFSNVISG
jgi:hypothetical protein